METGVNSAAMIVLIWALSHCELCRVTTSFSRNNTDNYFIGNCVPENTLGLTYERVIFPWKQLAL